MQEPAVILRPLHWRQLKVLVACEESGTVRDAFTRRGHFAMSCDLQPTRAPWGPHHAGDVVPLLGLGWDLLITHPPCTFLSSSGLHWNKNPNSPRFGGGQTEEALVFVRLLMAAPIHFQAHENPVGCIGTRIRPYDQLIQPYDFGDDASKRTCLWLQNLPPLKIDPAQRYPGRIVEWPRGSGKLVERWANQTDSGQNKLGPSETRARDRSKTYDGIAEAMAEQWSAHILETLRLAA